MAYFVEYANGRKSGENTDHVSEAASVGVGKVFVNQLGRSLQQANESGQELSDNRIGGNHIGQNRHGFEAGSDERHVETTLARASKIVGHARQTIDENFLLTRFRALQPVPLKCNF